MQRNLRADLRKVVAVALESRSWFIYLLNTPKAELGLIYFLFHFIFIYLLEESEKSSEQVCDQLAT